MSSVLKPEINPDILDNLRHPWQPSWVTSKEDVNVFLELMDSYRYLSDNEKIYTKVISPNFELKYNLTEKETLERIKKLIRYSNIEKNNKTLFIWPEGALSGKYFFEIEKYKKLIKENFSPNHLIIFGANTLDEKENKFFNSF